MQHGCATAKKPDVTEGVHLRRISRLSLPGKILEKIISKRLNRFLELNEILSEKQYGFRSGKSTLNAITALLDSIYNNLNKFQPTYVIYLDLKKAFDSVSHTTLSKKLIEIGLPEKSRNWFNSYLANRRQRVNLDGNLCTYRDIQYGVPLY